MAHPLGKVVPFPQVGESTQPSVLLLLGRFVSAWKAMEAIVPTLSLAQVLIVS